MGNACGNAPEALSLAWRYGMAGVECEEDADEQVVSTDLMGEGVTAFTNTFAHHEK